jgi:hypothetical protein
VTNNLDKIWAKRISITPHVGIHIGTLAELYQAIKIFPFYITFIFLIRHLLLFVLSNKYNQDFTVIPV